MRGADGVESGRDVRHVVDQAAGLAKGRLSDVAAQGHVANKFTHAERSYDLKIF